MESPESPVGIGEVGHVEEATGPVLRWIAAIETADALDRYPATVAGVARDLTDAGAGASATCRAVSGLHDALTRRLIDLAHGALGPPPCRYTWLALGSGGRMEQALSTDQDHAIVYADATGVDAHFAALGERVVAGLARAGLRRCPGGYMADKWRLPLASWRSVFSGWIDRPEPQALVEAEVFLDFRQVAGDLPVDQLAAVLRRGADTPRFLVGMARAAVRFAPPLGFAGRVRGDSGELDLKRAGLSGVVLLARLHALAAGSLVRPTPDRLAAAAAAGMISQDGAEALARTYAFLVELRLRTQLRQVAAGQPPGNRVRLTDLSADERRRLRRGLHTVRDVQRAVELHFHTHTVL
jgi:CBS domain-containing protein